MESQQEFHISKFGAALIVYFVAFLLVVALWGGIGAYLMIALSWAIISGLVLLMPVLIFVGMIVWALLGDLFGGKKAQEEFYGFPSTVSSATLAENVQAQETFERRHRGEHPTPSRNIKMTVYRPDGSSYDVSR